jgi:hypothetical protein
MKFNCAYDELLKIDDPKIIENPRNANIHPDAQIERLAQIIAYQGQRSPVVISKRSGYITKGHGRLLALRKLGWTEIAVNYQDYDNEAQEYSDIIADNEIARWATLDKDKVLEDIKELDISDINLLGLKDFALVEPEEIDLDELDHDDDKPKEYKIEVKFPNEMELRDIVDDLTQRGYMVKEL